MQPAELVSIETEYGAAVSSQGSERLSHFARFSELADGFAMDHIFAVLRRGSLYGLSYANLMHNFLGSLANLKLIEANRKLLAQVPGFGPGKLSSGEAQSDRLLVLNGASVLQLLRSVHTRTEGNDTDGAVAGGFVGQPARE